MLEINSSCTRTGRSDLDVDIVLEMSGKFSVLVPDIFLNIMFRVPLKSLSQCRWVCKSWYNLIKSQSFAKNQFEWAIKNNSPWVLFWDVDKDLYLIDDQVFHHLETSATPHKLELNEFQRVFHRDFEIAGFVNGLICFASNSECYSPSSYYICNPITGEHIIIPKSPNDNALQMSAFGFDPTTNKYKVIRIFLQDIDESQNYLISEGEVYALGSGEWRKIEDVPHIIDTEHRGVLLNGNIHWASYVSYNLVIIVFNVGAEKFSVIQPPYMVQENVTWNRLEVVEEHLCCINEGSFYKPFDMWVMEDYGVNSSWVKKYSLNWNVVVGWFGYRSNLIKLRNGEFLLKCDDQFMGYYDPKGETYRPIRANRSMKDRVQWIMQVGSLFSPKDIDNSSRWEGVTREGGENFLY